MSELRWHPLLREWVGVAANRQNRPQMPRDWCPFCPGSGRVPDHYDTLLYPNDFPAFSEDSPPFQAQGPPDAGTHPFSRDSAAETCAGFLEAQGPPDAAPDTRGTHPLSRDSAAETCAVFLKGDPGLFRSTGARGSCDVVIYHPSHTMLPSQMPVEHWRKVVDLWRERSAQLYANPEIACVYIFENTGVAIGVTMPHPHGQIYAFPFTPPLIERERAAAQDFFETEGECLYCRLLSGELAAEVRIVRETPHFVAFVPFHARWPGEMQIYPRRHVGALGEFDDAELTDLAALIKTLRMKYDNLWGFPIPLMMMVRQRPAKGESPYFHFHVEFCPIQRSPTKIKYLAGVESGAGTFLNDTRAEDKAAELRAAAPFELC